MFTVIRLVALAVARPARTTIHTRSRRSLLGGRRATTTRVTGGRR